MYYNDLASLIRGSSSSRKYFLSQPVKTQCMLHELNGYIHTLRELHAAVDSVNETCRYIELGGWE